MGVTILSLLQRNETKVHGGSMETGSLRVTLKLKPTGHGHWLGADWNVGEEWVGDDSEAYIVSGSMRCQQLCQGPVRKQQSSKENNQCGLGHVKLSYQEPAHRDVSDQLERRVWST